MIVIAARDASPADRARADVVCDGKTDVAVLSKAFAVSDREVELTEGVFDANAGFTSAGNRYLRPAENVTVRGAGPGGGGRGLRELRPDDPRRAPGGVPHARAVPEVGVIALLSLSLSLSLSYDPLCTQNRNVCVLRVHSSRRR